MKKITFPENEIIDIKKRFNKNKPVFTIRVSKEYNKYQKGDVLITNLNPGLKLIVTDEIKAKSFEELKTKFRHFHEAYKKYRKNIESIKKYKKIKILELKKYYK